MSPTMASLGLDKLTPIERRALVDELLETEEADHSPAPLTQAQAEELDRHITDDDANPDDLVSWEHVKAEARARHNR